MGLHHGGCTARTKKLRIKTNSKAIAPFRQFNIVDGGGGAFDAGIVDHHIKPAQVFQRIIKPCVNFGFTLDVHTGGRDIGKVVAENVECFFIHVADVYVGPFIIKRLGDGAANA